MMSATGMLGHRDVYVHGLSTTDPRLRSETVATKKNDPGALHDHCVIL